MREKINVLSLFDGMSCGRMALEELGMPINKYYASEKDTYAQQAARSIYPDTVQLGDVREVNSDNLELIDLLIGGSPCTNLSFAGKGQGLRGETLQEYLELKKQDFDFGTEQSYLFWEYIRILREIQKINPEVKFLLENVRMPKKWEAVITKELGVEPIKINSALVSAQNRQRLYWTNIEGIDQPEDRGIKLEDILEDLPDCPIGVKVREKSNCVRVGGRNSPFGSKQVWDSPFQRISKKGKVKPGVDKSACFTAGANSGGNHSDMDIIHTPWVTRRYSVREAARLQTIPEHATDKMLGSGVSNSQLYKMLGNGWTVEVIKHMFKNLAL